VQAIAAIRPTLATDGERIVADARAAGAVGFWLEDPWSPAFETPAMESLLAAVARTGCPLLVPVAPAGIYGAVSAKTIARQTGALGIPVVLVGSHYLRIVDDLGVATRFDHIHLETSNLAHWRAIETVVGHIGAERVLLGTGLPTRAAQASINAVLAAGLADDQKVAILSGNAARLFDLPPADVDLTRPIGWSRAWDAHTHTGAIPIDVPPIAGTSLVATLGELGTTRAVASSAYGVFTDPRAGNAEIVELCRRDPSLLGYLVVDPGDPEGVRDEIISWGQMPGVVGIKIHAQRAGIDTNSASMRKTFDVLADHGRPVLIHNAGGGWDAALLEIAHAHPRLPIIVAHAGLGRPAVEAGRVVSESERVYLELSSSVADLRVLRALVRTIDPGRLLWGSDAPLLDPAFVLGTYLDAGIDPDSADRIAWSNAESLFYS
jgi:hypothetical protein